MFWFVQHYVLICSRLSKNGKDPQPNPRTLYFNEGDMTREIIFFSEKMFLINRMSSEKVGNYFDKEKCNRNENESCTLQIGTIEKKFQSFPLLWLVFLFPLRLFLSPLSFFILYVEGFVLTNDLLFRPKISITNSLKWVFGSRIFFSLCQFVINKKAITVFPIALVSKV